MEKEMFQKKAKRTKFYRAWKFQNTLVCSEWQATSQSGKMISLMKRTSAFKCTVTVSQAG